MLMASLLVAAVALGCVLAFGGRTPRTSRTPHGLDRRLSWVERHPGEVDATDIERVLLRDGLSLADVRLVSDRAASLGVKPFTMWMWIKAYGARELAVAVAGDLPHDELLEHLGEGTLPDLHELGVLAALNGLEAASSGPGSPFLTTLAARSSGHRRLLSSLETHRADTWPPGVRPQVRASGDPSTPRRLPPGWDSFFDDLAV